MDADLRKRLETSIRFIKDGHTFAVGGFGLGKSRKTGRVSVSGYSQYIYLQNITPESIEQEFKQMKSDFQGLMSFSQKFTEFANEKGIDYYLSLDGGSKSAVLLASEENGIFKIFVKAYPGRG